MKGICHIQDCFDAQLSKRGSAGFRFAVSQAFFFGLLMARACQESKRGVNNPSGIYNIAPFGTQQKAMQGKLSPKRFGKGYGNLKAHTIEPKGDAQSNGFPSKQDMFVKLVSPQGLTNQVFTHFISIPN